ncbi:MAG: hypothetical protein JXA28_13485 [Bacteroidetes bacterium]|nr:hypothetical protein [Bacteroidota bacterium]
MSHGFRSMESQIP